jgi:hypothetical protein
MRPARDSSVSRRRAQVWISKPKNDDVKRNRAEIIRPFRFHRSESVVHLLTLKSAVAKCEFLIVRLARLESFPARLLKTGCKLPCEISSIRFPQVNAMTAGQLVDLDSPCR